MEIPAAGISLICESQLTGSQMSSRRSTRRRTRDSDAVIANLSDLRIGAPVVHIDHGVGRYRGLTTLDVGGTETDKTTEERERGFTDRLAAGGHTLFQCEYGDYTFDSGREAAGRLLSKRDRPDAIFCASDVMALGVLHAARFEFGMGVPADFSLIGFDDIPSAAWPGHQLTSIRQPIRRMIREAVDILIERIEDPDLAPRLVTYPGVLIMRATVRSPSTD